ncbi:hypothetical protein ABB02_00200 [Clostridiaceae bacterium JG1575]|nr:hypothetical protein ABB02_00200 [Clostridiaceae bacterium JG1575]
MNQHWRTRLRSSGWSFLVALSLVTGCQTAPKATTTVPPTKETVGATQSVVPGSVPKDQGTKTRPADPSRQAFPRTVNDQLGRSVDIPVAPQRIASAYHMATSSLLALGQEEHLVGVEKHSGKRALYGALSPQFGKIAQIGSGKEVHLEELARLKVDLLVVPARLKEQIPALEALKIPVVAINPESFQEQFSALTLLGEATGSVARADELVRWMQNANEETRLAVSGGKRPKVYLAGNKSPLSTAGKKMLQSEMLTLAGGQNVARELEDAYWADLSKEQLIAYAPEVILIVPNATYSKDDLLKDPLLKDVPAIRNGRIHQMPKLLEMMDAPVPASVVGTRWMAHVLHPEKVSDADFNRMVQGFYKTFYGIDHVGTK